MTLFTKATAGQPVGASIVDRRAGRSSHLAEEAHRRRDPGEGQQKERKRERRGGMTLAEAGEVFVAHCLPPIGFRRRMSAPKAPAVETV